MTQMDYHKTAFNSVGWFIPSYVTFGFLTATAKQIYDRQGSFGQNDLEEILANIYSSEHLAAMVRGRYPITEYVKDYKIIISECIAAHFLGLDHISVSGLMPVIEGSAKKIANSMSLKIDQATKKIFNALATECKQRAINKNIGAVGEIISMMDSFIEFAEKHLFIESKLYPLEDKTNRHGISHGAYSDLDYGKPINFYKCIAAINFLCFVSGFSTGYMPCFAPAATADSQQLTVYYEACKTIRDNKVLL